MSNSAIERKSSKTSWKATSSPEKSKCRFDLESGLRGDSREVERLKTWVPSFLKTKSNGEWTERAVESLHAVVEAALSHSAVVVEQSEIWRNFLLSHLDTYLTEAQSEVVQSGRLWGGVQREISDCETPVADVADEESKRLLWEVRNLVHQYVLLWEASGRRYSMKALDAELASLTHQVAADLNSHGVVDPEDWEAFKSFVSPTLLGLFRFKQHVVEVLLPRHLQRLQSATAAEACEKLQAPVRRSASEKPHAVVRHSPRLPKQELWFFDGSAPETFLEWRHVTLKKLPTELIGLKRATEHLAALAPVEAVTLLYRGLAGSAGERFYGILGYLNGEYDTALARDFIEEQLEVEVEDEERRQLLEEIRDVVLLNKHEERATIALFVEGLQEGSPEKHAARAMLSFADLTFEHFQSRMSQYYCEQQ